MLLFFENEIHFLHDATKPDLEQLYSSKSQIPKWQLKGKKEKCETAKTKNFLEINIPKKSSYYPIYKQKKPSHKNVSSAKETK
jgi:hypothetical protein